MEKLVHRGRAGRVLPMVSCRTRPVQTSVAPAAYAPGSPFTDWAHRLDADHPDKDGLQLRAISNVLKMFDKEAKKKYGVFCKVGVFIDYVSMPQRSRGSSSDDRTSGQKATFDRSLQACPPPAAILPTTASHPALPAPYQVLRHWYGHPTTHVLLVDTKLPAGAHTNMQPYAGRGWCMMERQTSGLVKNSTALISLKGLTGEERNIWEVRKNGKAAREPPVAPKSFASKLVAGVASATIKFTNPDDVGLVSTIYRKAFTEEMAAAVELDYTRMDWGDAQVITLCKALRAAHASGGPLNNLLTLDLSHNQIGDRAMEVTLTLTLILPLALTLILPLALTLTLGPGAAAQGGAIRGDAQPAGAHPLQQPDHDQGRGHARQSPPGRCDALVHRVRLPWPGNPSPNYQSSPSTPPPPPPPPPPPFTRPSSPS